MATMGDKLREARQIYARVTAATADLERAANRAHAAFIQLREERAAAAREARRQADAIRREGEKALRALRLPRGILAAFGLLTGFAGAMFYHTAHQLAGRLLAWFLG